MEKIREAIEKVTLKFKPGCILVIAFLAVAIVELKFLHYSIYLIGLEFSTLLLFYLFKIKNRKLKAIVSNALFFTLLFTVGEIYFTIQRFNLLNTKILHHWNKDLHVADPFRYYIPRPKQVINAKKTVGNKVIYEAKYSIDHFSMRKRIYADTKSTKTKKTVAFFGCSFVYGAGLNDVSTLPNLLEQKSHYTLKAYNFGYSAYSASQFYNITRSGLIDKVLGKENFTSVYVMISRHVERDAKAYQFSNRMLNIFYAILKKSLLYLKFSALVEMHSFGLEYYIRLLKLARKNLEEKYGSNLLILIWDNRGRSPTNSKDRYFDKVYSRLLREGFKVTAVENEIFARKTTNFEKFHIPFDGHPTRLANEEIANYLLRKLEK